MSRTVVADAVAEKSRPPRTLRRRFWRLRTMLILSLLLVAGLPVAARFIRTTRWAVGNGYLITDQDAELRPSVEGAIEKCLVVTGQSVERDQLLVQLNSRVQRAEYEESVAEVTAKEAQYKQLLSSQQLEIAQRKEQIARAEQTLKMAENYLQRLTSTGVIARDVDIDEARLRVQTSTSQLAELNLPREDLQEKQVTVLREQIDQARKKVAVQEAQLRMREIRSPIRGVVQLNRFEAGEVVKPDHVLGQVFDRDAWVVKLKIPEESVPYVKAGQHVEVALAAYPTLRYGYMSATVTRIVPVVTPRANANGVCYAEARVVPPSSMPIEPGMTATGYIDAGRTNWLYRLLGW